MLSENFHVARYDGPWIGNGAVSGRNHYSIGVHHLHFRLLEKFYESPFFGIVSADQTLNDRILHATSTFGWKNYSQRVIAGQEQEEGRDRLIQPGDDLTLTLDCERRQLLFKHHRSQRLVQLPVDIKLCPFPWKLLIVLRRRTDAVRLLGGTVSFMTEDLLNRLNHRSINSN